ncbi:MULTISPECIES: helicase-exonuclease AddAB subunit AddA [Lactobacillus]|uniref:ATP-dependent helicase/nuclease subunit A n=1 Tax=Lactobacillus xujianguonis TaxID=2495899 RepID=A0A437SXU2_9LACO|nr:MULTISPECIES: helicase-exonuclease AddAB subunit AddA [Lactobacillus]RVU71728.1 helicase-exonuclease AddAB subunit AddA [Lactobacillus xujianguonis]RVU77558.1 helicase-exonuclease AddAB subunit AddA [Lactobacillus xujianguonis]
MPFTKEQEQAINDRGHDILVSASAGSGKTTVLVQRVLKQILSGTSVDQLLVVTFTKAAAEEMKTRIKNELSQALKQADQNQDYLREQLNQVDTANISTIDAFCLDVIHRFYYVVDLDPSFSILTDETQAALLKERALKEIEAEKLTAKDQNFIDFYQNFAGDRDADAARNLLLDLYDFAMARPNYQRWLTKLAQSYEIGDKELVQTRLWQEKIKPYLVTTFSDLQSKVQKLLDIPIIETKELAKVKDNFASFSQKLDSFVTALKTDQNYDQLQSLLRNCLFLGRYSKSKKWDEDLIEFYDESQALKKEAKDQVFETFTSFFATSEKEQVELMKKGQRLMMTISRAEQDLIDRFNSFKRAENLLDYSDMEQLAFKILSQDTSTSQVARDFYQNKFKEILVDEYQDINALQENIIQLLKKEHQNTLFMVGDVKQSIYGFRQAEPSLFLKKYHNYGNDDLATKRILLSDNFRSTETVVDFVNDSFNPVLSRDFGGIDYQKEGRLIYGASYYPKHLDKASEIIFHEKQRTSSDNDDDEKDDLDFAEIQMVIARIKQFKEEKLQVYDAHSHALRDFRYSDIAILTRSRSDNLQIMQEFAKSKIPLFVTDAANYFQTFELTVMMDYLKIIDNPDQDIPLVAVLRSPLFSFDEVKLAQIRVNSKYTSFYNALLAYVGKRDALSKKVGDFLNQLEDLRNFASNHRISELIWSIYERTSLLEIMTALPNGEQRRVNLEALYERATSYESAGFKGLYQFINFINRMRQSKKDLAQPLLTKEAGNSVRLMTIHGSKGLEFPIVFYVGLEHKYQMRDLRQNYIINDNNVGLTIKQPEYRVDSLVKAIGNVEKKGQILKEEARILYVALTRAKQKLILVSDISNLAKKIQTWSAALNNQGNLPLATKLSATSPLSFIGPSLDLGHHLTQKISEIDSEIDQNEKVLYIKYDEALTITTDEDKTDDVNEQQFDLLTKTVNQLYDFRYPFKDASQTTAYQAVSEIKRAFNDPIVKELENARLDASTNRYLQPIDTKPNFLFETKFTGAEMGTATHLLLQYYDYTGAGDEASLKQEIQTLIDHKKLNPEIVDSISLDEIEWFVHSDFAKGFWEHPDRLKREVDFSSLLAAKTLFHNFSDPNAKILVHGTIDGYFITNDGIILFDYKTDHVDQAHLELAINKIKAKYTGQLRLYEQALNEFSSQKVIGKYLILLDAKKIVAVD